eukprot:s2721_g13.t1
MATASGKPPKLPERAEREARPPPPFPGRPERPAREEVPTRGEAESPPQPPPDELPLAPPPPTLDLHWRHGRCSRSLSPHAKCNSGASLSPSRLPRAGELQDRLFVFKESSEHGPPGRLPGRPLAVVPACLKRHAGDRWITSSCLRRSRGRHSGTVPESADLELCSGSGGGFSCSSCRWNTTV